MEIGKRTVFVAAEPDQARLFHAESERTSPMTDDAKRPVEYAISIRQPWATLVVHQIKTIEIRSWPTARRGRIWIHAASISDDRDEAWKHLPDDLQLAAKRKRGLVGRAEIIDCVTYATQEVFVRDQKKHLNEAKWFRRPPLYGFVIANAEPAEFRPMRGWVRIFRMADDMG